MRVLQSGIYNNFIQDQSAAKAKIDQLTTQISSGKKIEHSYEDSAVYVDTLRLDSEINSLKGIQDRTLKSKVLTDASDSAMNDFDSTLIDFKSKLILAANGTMNADNLKSVASDLEQTKEHLMNLANSSINGQYLFSGSAVNVKPIDSDGNYHGNDKSLKTLVSKSSELAYTVDGNALFLGVDNSMNKSVSTNVHLQNQTTNTTLKVTDSVDDLLGAGGGDFLLSGVGHDGKAFKSHITLNGSDDISALLAGIENAYGTDAVKAELSDQGTIMIRDLKKGNSSLDFQMSATNATTGTAIDFTKNNNTLAVANNDDSALFTQTDNVLTGNVPMLLGDGFATAATKLSEISNSTLAGKTFEMQIKDVNGASKTVTLDLANPSSFSVSGAGSFAIYDADETTQTNADDFTLGQLGNVISMAMADKLPTGGRSYHDAVVESKESIEVGLNSDGALKIESKDNKPLSFSLYDKDTTSSSLSFMGNKAVVVDNPKIDFFKDLDTIIEAVKSGMTTIDATGENPSNPGIQNAIGKLDSLTSHFASAHTTIGAMSNNLQHANDRASVLELNVTQLKSEVADVDIAEAAIQYNQVSLNYQAMMSTIAKVNSLTLLNYLK